MKLNKLRKKIMQGMAFILGIAAGFSVGFFGAMYMETMDASAMDWCFAIFSVAAALYLQIILHEAGHLVFGLFSGYKFVSFRIGSFIIYKKQNRFRFGRYTLAGTGGQCLMAPPDFEDGKMPYCLYNLGGVLMNLMMAGVFTFLFLSGAVKGVAGVFGIAMILVGFFYAVTNGIPMHMNGLDNDGYNALSMGKNEESLRALWIQLKINERLTEGQRLKDMPEEWFEKPSERGMENSMENSMVAAIEAARCNRLLDRQAFEEAGRTIEEVLREENAMAGVQKMLLQIDGIFCEILGEQRKEILGQLEEKELKTFMKAMKNFPSVVRTQYAYALLIEKDAKKAEKLKERFVKLAKSYPNTGEIESEYELLTYCVQGQDETKEK